MYHRSEWVYNLIHNTVTSCTPQRIGDASCSPATLNYGLPPVRAEKQEKTEFKKYKITGSLN